MIINHLWKEFLSQEGINGKRYEKLTNYPFWSIDHKLETLNLSRNLSNDSFSHLMKVKKKRNKLIHDFRRVSKSDAESAFSLAVLLVKKGVGIS